MVPAACAALPGQTKNRDAPLAASAVADLEQVDPLGTLLNLARQIRARHQYVGYSFFILLALCKHIRPVMWEGMNRIPLVETFAPWALETCDRSCGGVEGVCCCFQTLDGGTVSMRPVSEDLDLSRCRRYVASVAVPEETNTNPNGDSIEDFYMRLGRALLGTVVDGDCGVDVGCMMPGLA